MREQDGKVKQQPPDLYHLGRSSFIPLCNLALTQKREASVGFDVPYWGVLSRESHARCGWTVARTAPLFLNVPSSFYRLTDLRLYSFFPHFISHLSLFPQALASSFQLSSPSLRPSVSLHISLGLAPLIKHSCRSHRKAPLLLFFFSTLLYKLAGCLSQALALLILGDVKDCCLCLGHRVDSAVSSDCTDLYANECVCVCVCMFIQVCTLVELKYKLLLQTHPNSLTWLLSFMLWQASIIKFLLMLVSPAWWRRRAAHVSGSEALLSSSESVGAAAGGLEAVLAAVESRQAWWHRGHGNWNRSPSSAVIEQLFSFENDRRCPPSTRLCLRAVNADKLCVYVCVDSGCMKNTLMYRYSPRAPSEVPWMAACNLNGG